MAKFMSPGFDIFKTWQGIVEMILRAACVVSACMLDYMTRPTHDAVTRPDGRDSIESQAHTGMHRIRPT